MLTYEKRNREKIAELAPNTKAAAEKLHDFAIKNNIDILIYDAKRTEEQQRLNVQNGASQTMKSYHLVGQAIDFVPIVKGQAAWNGYGSSDVAKFVNEAKRLGFEWGGDWKDFVDKPHLQFNYKGYGTDKVLEVVKVEPKQVVSSFAKEAVEWAKKLGISDGSRPQDNITRQEMLTILHRYDQKRGE